MSFDITIYLERIGLSSCPATLTGLQHLQRAQMSTIALENVEVLLGRGSDLSSQGAWNKLVERRCGGSSVELNRLLGSALNALGFVAKPILSRTIANAANANSSTQLAWLVTIDQQDFLVDVGLGILGPFAPILESNQAQPSSGTMFRVIFNHDTGRKTLQRKIGEGWLDLYWYDDAPVGQADLERPNLPPCRGEHSPLNSDLIMSIHRPDGRLSVMNGTATTEGNIGSRSWEFATLTDFAAAVRTTFLLNYSDEELARVWTAIGKRDEREAA